MAKELYGLKILVVDDDKDTLELLEWVLKRAGAEVTAVSSAKAAMEALERDRPTILVSDIAMPEEDGLGLMRRIRALPKERGGRIPAVALTAHSMVQDRLQSLRAGFQSHVPKPGRSRGAGGGRHQYRASTGAVGRLKAGVCSWPPTSPAPLSASRVDRFLFFCAGEAGARGAASRYCSKKTPVSGPTGARTSARRGTGRR
jgi:CheY-like chemotaxis protein